MFAFIGFMRRQHIKKHSCCKSCTGETYILIVAACLCIEVILMQKRVRL